MCGKYLLATYTHGIPEWLLSATYVADIIYKHIYVCILVQKEYISK